MSKVTLTPIQRDTFRQIAGTGVAKDAKEATIKALLRRNLIAPDGDGFTLTKAGLAFRALDVKEIAAAAAEKNGSVKATKPTGVAKKAAKAAEDKAKREAVEHVPNVPGEVETDAPVVEPKAAPKTERLTMVKDPKPAVDKDGTIRLSKQILGYLATVTPLVPAELDAKITAAVVAKDESKRIAVTDADLDALSGYATAMAAAENTGRGDVRSARALIQWIDGMKARRASKK